MNNTALHLSTQIQITQKWFIIDCLKNIIAVLKINNCQLVYVIYLLMFNIRTLNLSRAALTCHINLNVIGKFIQVHEIVNNKQQYIDIS